MKDPATRRFYLEACAEHGGSRAVLTVQVESRLHERQGRAPSNFAATLPPPQSDLVQQVTKDPYIFDFLTLSPDARERDLERGLLLHLRDFLVELGVGFAFVGSQVHLEVAGEDFYVDLLFYHLRLRCFVVVELKMGSFQPEYAGKMNFYVSAVDAQLDRGGELGDAPGGVAARGAGGELADGAGDGGGVGAGAGRDRGLTLGQSALGYAPWEHGSAPDRT